MKSSKPKYAESQVASESGNSSRGEKKGIIRRLGSWYKSRNRLTGGFTDFALLVATVASCVLVILIFLEKINVEAKIFRGLKPTVLVIYGTTVVATASLAFVTRQVDAYLWTQLIPGKGGLNLGEIGSLAQWTVSPVARLAYVASGATLSIKLLGMLLFVNPFLQPLVLQGIVEREIYKNISIPLISQATAFSYRGWMGGPTYEVDIGSRFRQDEAILAAASFVFDNSIPPILLKTANDAITLAKQEVGDAANAEYTENLGRNTADRTVEQLEYLGIQLPEPLSVNRTSLNLTLDSVYPVIEAACHTEELDNALFRIADGSASDFGTREFRNETSGLTVTLGRGLNGTFANFTTAYQNSPTKNTLPNGVFGYIFGAFVPVQGVTPRFRGSKFQNPLFQIGCTLSFGLTTIRQHPMPSPRTIYSREKKSFTPANISLYDADEYLRRLAIPYNIGMPIPPSDTEEDDDETDIPSAFTFAARRPQKRLKSYYDARVEFFAGSAVGHLLLGSSKGLTQLLNTDDPSIDAVPLGIQEIWETASKMALIRDPLSSESLRVFHTKMVPVMEYRYRRRYLGFFFIPLLAVFASVAGVFHKYNTGKEIIVGYDPVLIAMRGGKLSEFDDELRPKHGYLPVDAEKFVAKGEYKEGSKAIALKVYRPSPPTSSDSDSDYQIDP
ncbi:hypothetical protein BJ508DRAFT_367221 [Ascobolus immersus RN42]|uniref:Uncharacterized protein n=1 Tax=Ascobolus immersus RN42 TaxID=1160509 RepID=A0A3N4HE06_ASCIM|nr:hypothetical protein BJ508DRAFT_367221 [Ascobolus immersus RN42]